MVASGRRSLASWIQAECEKHDYPLDFDRRDKNVSPGMNSDHEHSMSSSTPISCFDVLCPPEWVPSLYLDSNTAGHLPPVRLTLSPHQGNTPVLYAASYGWMDLLAAWLPKLKVNTSTISNLKWPGL